jgi:hypothetical protein
MPPPNLISLLVTLWLQRLLVSKVMSIDLDRRGSSIRNSWMNGHDSNWPYYNSKPPTKK